MKDAAVIIHLLGLVMGLGTGIGMMFLGIAASKMDEAARNDFSVKILALGGMGRIGLVLSILSGGYLMTPYWSILSESPILMAKMGLVILLIVLIGLIEMTAKKAKQPGGEVHLAKLQTLGKITMLTAIGVLITAVLYFH